MAAPSELSKIKLALSGLGLDIRQVNGINPRLIVRDVPAELSKEDFIAGLVKQNLGGTDTAEIRMVYRFPACDRGAVSVVIEVSPEVRRKLIQSERIYMGWTACRIADHVRITQCFKCLGFGHISKNCKGDKDTCGHCGEAHESRACTNKSGQLRCHNCTNARMTVTDHSALDAQRCPIIQRRLEECMRRIQF